jgi:hypothetical protein
MRKRRAGPVLVLLAATAMVAGCGVPANTKPVVVGDAPRLGAHSDANPKPPDGPDGAGTPLELVKRFLAASAWGNEITEDRPRAFDDAVDKVRQFIVEEQRASWQPKKEKNGLAVVRVVDTGPPVPATGGEVILTLLPLGVLGDNGRFEPKLGQPYNQTFVVKQSAEGGLRIDNPPADMLLLSDEALRDWYELHPIYFWDVDDKLLVPDLRYLAKVVPGTKRPNEIVKWLLGGPSSWLNGLASPVPGITLQDKLYYEGNTLVVNLAAKAASLDPAVLGHFVHQLRWSLRPSEAPVDLRIGGNKPEQAVPGSSDRYLAFNPSGPPTVLPEPDAFVVSGGQVHPVRRGADRAVPVLTAEQNVGIVAAALTRDRAALVRADGNRRRLFLGRFDSEQGPVVYRDTGLVRTTMSRPVWLSQSGPRVLVAADGKLFDVSFPDGASSDGVTRREVDMGDLDGRGPVTAFAVAPDGWRIALVVRNVVYLAELVVDDKGLRIGHPHPVSTRAPSEPAELVEVKGVGWSREDWVVVAGRSAAGGSALVEVTVDGARAERLVLASLESLTVTGVVAQPQSPVNGSPGFLMVEAEDGVYKVFSRDVGRLLPSSSSPPPSAKPPVLPPVASAPFFLGLTTASG